MSTNCLNNIGCEKSEVDIDGTWETGQMCCVLEPGNSSRLEITERNQTVEMIINPSSTISGILISFHIVHYLPRMITCKLDQKPCDNLKFLRVRRSSLIELRPYNFENFQNLIYLDVSWNKIKFLERNLFHHCEKLKRIWLNNNKIIFVDSDAFLNLVNSAYLNLEDNDCCNGKGKFEELLNTSICSQDCHEITLISAMLSVKKSLDDMPNVYPVIHSDLKMFAFFVLLLLILIVQLYSLCCRKTQISHACAEQKPQKGIYATVAEGKEDKKQAPLSVVTENGNRKGTDSKNNFEMSQMEEIYSELNGNDGERGSLGVYDGSQELYSEVKKA